MQTICFEVYPRGKNINKMRKVLVNKHGFEERENRYGSYFYGEVPNIDAWQTKTMLNINNYAYKSFDRRYERSSNYRDVFFRTHKGPYRCAYCGRHLKPANLEVDHLIPVAKAKTSMAARTFLHLAGARSVNDAKNLVSACKKCNGKKSDKIGLWVPRGIIGRFNIVWTIRDVMITAILVIAGLIVWNNFDAIREFVDAIIRSFNV